MTTQKEIRGKLEMIFEGLLQDVMGIISEVKTFDIISKNKDTLVIKKNTPKTSISVKQLLRNYDLVSPESGDELTFKLKKGSVTL